ncbi:MAG TPA: hypothetical protein VFI65_17545 [Streptosporangiaceae bacterium]|nr:hypothetical protein [Streptosporangiaceae bacterium]
MLALVVLIYIAVMSATGAVEYWIWLRQRLAADREQPDRDRGRSLSFLTESLAALGVILVLAGSGVAVSEHWLYITNWARFAILAIVAACLLIAGFVVRWLTASTTERLTQLMWSASVACAAGAAVIAADRIYREPAVVTALTTSATVAVYAAVLWLLCRREILMVGAFAGLTGAVCSAIPVIAADAAPWLAIGLVLWLLGLAWGVLGWLYPEPFGTSVPAGAALALIGPVVAVPNYGWVYAIGIGTAIAVMAASIPLQNVVLVAFGSCALLGYIVAVVLRYADQSIGMPGSLVIIGLTLISLAVVTVRLGRRTT